MLRRSCWCVRLAVSTSGMLTVSNQRKYAEFGFRIAQSVEDHHAQGVLNRRGVAGLAKRAGETLKA
jgi:hypothetical protein